MSTESDPRGNDALLNGPALGEPSDEPKPHGDPADHLPSAASDETMGAVPDPEASDPAVQWEESPPSS
jgi:hypothetical protein